jgi:nucleoid-associated protein
MTTLILSNAVLHQLVKTGNDEWQIQLSDQCLPNSDSTLQFLNQLHKGYFAKGVKGLGFFRSESEFSAKLPTIAQDEADFLHFSAWGAERLKNEISQCTFAEAGTLVMAQYEYLATEYLLIAMLPTYHSMQVTQSLQIHEIDYLDIAKMDVAACVDLSQWRADSSSHRYLTFIKGRVGRKIADFFLSYLQAEVGLDVKAQNKTLIKTVDDFCAANAWEEDESLTCRQTVQAYCQAQWQNGDEIDVSELSGELAVTQPRQSFAAFSQAQDTALPEHFPVDRTVTRQLTKYVGSGGGLSLQFDAALLNDRIFYDPETDTLTIKGTPPNLKDQLKRRLKVD